MSADLTGSSIDGWQVAGKIGEGAMGAVYEATRGPQRAAFKVALPEVLGPDNLQRFRREARILMGLEHPHVVRCYHAGEADRFVYLALEFLAGQDLEAILQERGRLSVPEAVGVVRRVLRGLEAAHERGVLHRDVKPGNVMLDARGVPKLLDFGLAKARGQANITAAGAVLGTIDYMAPEQFEAAADADARADLYSVGCLLYHLVTGSPPYTGRSSLAVLQQHKEAPVPSPVHEGGIAEAAPLERAIEALMAKDPRDRPRSARAALALFEGLPEAPLVPGGSLDPPPEAREESTAGAPRPSCLADLFAAALLLCAAAALGDALLRGTGRPGLPPLPAPFSSLERLREPPFLGALLGLAAAALFWRLLARRR